MQQTDGRRLLFESYAEDVMSAAGMHIWDGYGINAVGTSYDMVHQDGGVNYVYNADVMETLACFA